MGMLYLCSIEKQRTKHRSAMQQGVNAIAPRCILRSTFLSNSTMLGVSIREKSDVKMKFFVEKMRETQDF